MSRIVDISNLTVRYGSLLALDNISFAIEEGELFGLIGPDGAGKSTLYKILATLLHPTSGTAKLCGLDTVKAHKQLRTMIGYMPERFSLYRDLSVEENLNFFAHLFGVKVNQNFDLIEPIYRQLSQFPNRRAGALSGGMKQKLALSCALIHRPKILLLDEPTTGVDAVSRSEFWAILQSLKAQGITILVSTSYMDEANLCERIALINKGRILDTDTPTNLIKRIDEKIVAAQSSDMFELLGAMRRLPGVKECYTFGAVLHAVVTDRFDTLAAKAALEREGLQDVTLVPAQGNIEDLFIKLIGNGEQ